MATAAESGEETTAPGASSAPYNATFWACYVANTGMMIAISCTFRYADFIHLHGGTEWNLGLVVGVGATGALLARVLQAYGLDRVGPRIMWLTCLAGYIVSMLLHPMITSVDGPMIFATRILTMLGLAGSFGAALTFVSQTAPPGRMGELLGMLGTSGFLGLAIGPSLSDWLLGADPVMSDVHRMFYVAAGTGAVAWVTAYWATRHAPKPEPRSLPSWATIREFHPGTLLFVAAAMGLGLSLPGVFVRSFAREAGLGGIGPFFMIYASTAFVLRILTRRLSDRIGVRPVVLTGLALLSISMLMFLLAKSPYTLVIPAVGSGFAHALLFPAVVSGGNMSFPLHYRGLATTITLTMFDIGNMLGQPLVGLSVHLARSWGLPPYPTMFVMVALLIACANGLFFLFPPALRIVEHETATEPAAAAA